MSFDFKAVADAIAVRFGPTIVTAPSGETNIQQSTASLPDAISDEPTVLVFPPAVRFTFGTSLRKAVAEYPVRFYLYKVRSHSRNTDLLNNWITALYATLDGQGHLGLSGTVNYGWMTDVQPGPLEYNGTNYDGLEWTVKVNLGEGMTVTAGA
jgi:hypothetical protein